MRSHDSIVANHVDDRHLRSASARVERVRRRLREFFALAKPRVLSLIVFTAVIGMMLATPGLVPLRPFVFGAIGIALVAGAAAATNCLLELKKDAVMARTRARPLPRGRITPAEAAAFAVAVGAVGLVVLYTLVNPLTMWLTLATFVGYAFVYTLVLKPRTPQNIVLGGAAGAMPPVLGWTAVTGEVSFDALLLFLIIFVWTPPHFWSLALYRRNEYAQAGVPMLPVTHGTRYTQRQVLLYTVGLFAISLLPFCIHMSGLFYLTAAVVLGAIFIAYAAALYRRYSDRLAHATFRYSIAYLALLFAALLGDHYL
jgi:heme o synthase